MLIERTNLTIMVAIPLILLAATAAISFMITEDAFAKNGRYTGDTSQAAAVSNDCLNTIFDSNNIDNAVGVGNCGGTISQQDESGSASAPITSQTANPDIELQRTTTSTQPGLGSPLPPGIQSCVGCFSTLTTAEQAQFLLNVNDHFPTIDTSMGFSNAIEQLCELFEQAAKTDNLPEALELLDEVLTEGPSPIVDEETSTRIQFCISNSGL